MSSGARQIGVIGAGSWGTALAIQLARCGSRVLLWGRDPRQIAHMAGERENARYLPGCPFPDGLTPEGDLDGLLRDCRDLLVAVPSDAFRETLVRVRRGLRPDTRVAWGTKGLELSSGLLAHEVAGEVLGRDIPVAVLSGPTFAGEVARGLPAAITVAATDREFAFDLAQRLYDGRFRAYTSQDMPGVEVGGAVKNVMAIAAGISDGLRFGANARAALITRGLAEIMRLGTALGGELKTFMGLAGLGDLVLTCTDDQSRNRRMGLALAAGRGADQARARIGLVEGVHAARAVWEKARSRGVEMPITEHVYRVLYEGMAPREAVESLTTGEPKQEL
ncbi:MAG TPA: NAD(P)H-dependent glycerol-3-phosphate dehydrogenase [Gammaproteobacteria bacterium]|nr:NAD(P)H-dependent glycerol-3-phosphate dehydrogenase [Gammaproteobacteria bacterium]